MRITREVEVEIDVDDLIEEIDDDVLIDEIRRRRKDPVGFSNVSLQTIYEEFRRRGDAPQCLKDYIYDTLGKVL
jgi:hypothetical protein